MLKRSDDAVDFSRPAPRSHVRSPPALSARAAAPPVTQPDCRDGGLRTPSCDQRKHGGERRRRRVDPGAGPMPDTVNARPSSTRIRRHPSPRVAGLAEVRQAPLSAVAISPAQPGGPRDPPTSLGSTRGEPRLCTLGPASSAPRSPSGVGRSRDGCGSTQHEPRRLCRSPDELGTCGTQRPRAVRWACRRSAGTEDQVGPVVAGRSVLPKAPGLRSPPRTSKARSSAARPRTKDCRGTSGRVTRS